MAYAPGTQTITVGFPDDLLARVDERAARAGMSRAEWIRKVCEARLELPIAAVERRELL